MKIQTVIMNIHKFKNIILLSAVSFIFTSCGAVTTNYQRPDINTQSLYRDVKTTEADTVSALPWRSMFNDAILQKLIEEGLSNNLDLQIAVARIKQAEAGFIQSRLAFFPNLTVNGTATFTRNKTNNAVSTSELYQLSLTSDWEIDIWAKLTSAKRAELAALLESEANRNAVITTLIADIANSYYSLLALDAQLGITQKTIEIRIADVNTMKELKESAVVTGAAVVQSEANRYAAEITIPDIKQNIRIIENSLSILLGRPPDSVKRATLEEQNISEVIQTGVPSQLLSNRPDVMQAEYAFRYAFEITNVARAYFYPALTITASEGISDGKINSLFNPGTVIGNLIGGLTAPIFNQGLNTARLETASAKQEEAMLNYKKALLTAGGEVSDALFAYKTAAEKIEVRKKQIASLEKSVDYTKELLIFGTANYTEVLTAEQNLLSAKLSQVTDRLQQLQSTVALYRSLGGGWKE